MSDNGGSKVSYFLVGLGIGTLLGILLPLSPAKRAAST